MVGEAAMSGPVIIGRATLYCGDSQDIVPILGKVDAVIADPPYAVPTIVATGRETTRNAGDLSMIETAYRVHADLWADALGEDGRAFVFCDGASYPSVYRAMYGRYNLASLVWSKGRIGMGREFRKSHELIVHAWRNKTPIFSDGEGRADVLQFPAVPTEERVHPAQKPVDLIRELLTVCGPRILDPFMGSGATGVAAIRSGRDFVGVEICPDNFKVACKRIAEVQGDAGPLFGEAA
jgi:site-specific DNA-methyltransferase (adenine-specific)